MVAATDTDGQQAEFSSDEEALVEELYAKASAEGEIRKVLLDSLSTIPPTLILKLRQPRDHASHAIRIISNEMSRLLDAQLEEAKTTLQQLLDAGELRKLDSLIGKAASAGKLDAAFFNVLSVNLQNAASGVSRHMDSTSTEGSSAASRLQILQHVYTRCQEEVEKSIPPGLALLNKLIRQQQESIRNNLYEYYLTPQSNKIRTPDGQELELKGQAPPLVSLDEFISALSKTVLQIRTAEKAGATDRASSASMVEACRQIAKEARLVIANSFGPDSVELDTFQNGLQPVFRPASTDSPYITGES
ncbi:hypothetical protein ACA910_005119 [Epithemia clementina (nom. ined.)]